jgi:hypothetical protein
MGKLPALPKGKDMRAVFCAFVLLSLAFLALASGEPRASRSWGHAHNDYRHPRPLFDALDHGFRSIEADVLLVGDELMVAHDRIEVRPGRTLGHLYLDPLLRLHREGHPALADDHPSGPLLLLVDFKTEAEPAYLRLKELLEPCRPMLTRFEGNRVVPGAVMVVVSGNRPVDLMAREPERLAAADGRLSDLNREMSEPSLMPLVSDHWRSHFSWDGQGDMPEDERAHLHDIVARARARGHLLRFWATPEREALWRELVAAGVDYINTDRLGEVRDFLATNGEDAAHE